jgi:hypothetical protein
LRSKLDAVLATSGEKEFMRPGRAVLVVRTIRPEK